MKKCLSITYILNAQAEEKLFESFFIVGPFLSMTSGGAQVCAQHGLKAVFQTGFETCVLPIS